MLVVGWGVVVVGRSMVKCKGIETFLVALSLEKEASVAVERDYFIEMVAVAGQLFAEEGEHVQGF